VLKATVETRRENCGIKETVNLGKGEVRNRDGSTGEVKRKDQNEDPVTAWTRKKKKRRKGDRGERPSGLPGKLAIKSKRLGHAKSTDKRQEPAAPRQNKG